MSVMRKLRSKPGLETERTFRSATFRFVAALLCGFLAITASAAAQSVSAFDTGTIIGTITDSTGAVIPGASVTITNIDTARQTKTVTGARGSFVAPGLPFGKYEVSATASHFQQSKTRQFVLNVGATVNIHLALSVAGSTQSIEVTGTSTTINTTSASSGTTLNETQIRNLPTNGAT